MIPLALDDIARLCPGRLDRAGWTDEATGVQVDSRRVDEGDLFVAVGDGAVYRKHALARGAAATLLPEDAFASLSVLAAAIRSRSEARVVGITGSTGKTSTKDILAGLVRPHARVVAAEGGHNNEIGLPLTLLRIEPDTEVVVAEMGMRGLGQIDALCDVAKPDVGVITSIGPVHLELLGTVERVAEAKAEIIGALPPGGTAVAPAGVPELEPHLDRDDIGIRRFGPGGDAWIESFRRHGSRARIVFAIDGVQHELEFAFSASYQASNALAALLAYEALGFPLAEAQAGADGIQLSRWRGEETALPGGGLLINDAYNANPVSMRAALRHLAERAEGRRRVAILGEMAELGSEAPRYHREVGDAAREQGVEVLLAVGTLARDYLPANGSPWAADAEQAAALARDLVREGDCVLVKGSRSVGLERVAEALQTVTA